MDEFEQECARRQRHIIKTLALCKDQSHPNFEQLKQIALECAGRGEFDLAHLIAQCAAVSRSPDATSYLSKAVAAATRRINAIFNAHNN